MSRYPDDYRSDRAPDGYVTRDQQDADEASALAVSLAGLAEEMQGAAVELLCDSDWRIPRSMSAAAVTALEHRMTVLRDDLRSLAQGQAPKP